MKLLDFEGQSVLDSRDVAKMIGKEHKNLMRDIRTYIKDIEESSNLSSRQFFIPSTYTSKQGKVLPNYLLTKQGCEFVANKMTGKKGNQFTAQYVSLFNQMKQQIEIPSKFNIPKTLPEALRLAADQAEQLAKQKPKVDYFDSQMRNPGLMTTTEIAKDYGWSAKTLNKRHIIFKQGKHWVLYQKYADKGYTQYEPYDYQKNNGQHGVHNNLKWTQKGKKFIYDLLAKDDIHPVAEQMNLLEV
ncbi:MAG: phage regulatory protein/antirepressor Ant [Lactobacillus crispatus]|nr:phage regulatory protein/antirepressor Ant [Lactobacillus crispatus]